MTGEERSHSGSLAADASQCLGIADGIDPSATVFDRHQHPQQTMPPGQGNHLIVEAMFEIAQLFDRANLLAERFDIRQQWVLFVKGHDGLWHFKRSSALPAAAVSARVGLRQQKA